MRKITVIHGPNLNLLGRRNPDVYGTSTLKQINERISARAKQLGVTVKVFQSNREGEIIDAIHAAQNSCGIIINPGAYTHTSVAIRDAIEAVAVPAIEVHISNIFKRESFRHKSLIAPVCAGQITGLAEYSYLLAIDYFARRKQGS